MVPESRALYTRRWAGVIAAALLVLAQPAWARETAGKGGEWAFKAAEALKTSQAAIGRPVRDAVFRDTAGRTVRLSDFRGKPLVVSFIYTSCSDICPTITRSLEDAVAMARDALGAESFNVVTVGFDVAADKPERMRMFKNRRGIRDKSWRFLSGELTAVAGLADDLGFTYYESAKGFDHLAQVSVIDGSGTVYRQIYGESFAKPLLVDPLKDLVFGTTSPFASVDDLVKRVRLFCTIYDPSLGRYRFDYSIFIRLGIGAAIIIFLSIFIVREWRRGGRRSGPGGSPA